MADAVKGEAVIMCGIVGVLSYQDTFNHVGSIVSMSNTLAHRGPDDKGAWSEPHVSLAHRRLSVIDLSASGAQPMHSSSGRYVIVYNGEVYNHKSLRDLLGKSDWRGSSDTETVIELIDKFGVEVTLKKIEGMFAFALWDRKKRQMTLARDRAGEKPLFYGWIDKDLVFSSELKAIKSHPNWRGNISRGALVSFLQYGFVPSPNSIYENVRKLPPGSYVVYPLDAEPKSFFPPVQYWSATSAYQSPLAHKSFGDAVDDLETKLISSIKQQLISDVPVGAFLSGGIDSSLVVALAQEQLSQSIKTFTIGFSDKLFNEAPHARLVAQHLQTAHTELIVEPHDALEVLPSMPMIYDEPFGDVSCIPTYLVARLAREQVTVALSGDGADELFGGYRRYGWVAKVWRVAEKLPLKVRLAIAAAIHNMPASRIDEAAHFCYRLLPKNYRLPALGDKLNKFGNTLAFVDADDLYVKLISQVNFASDAVHDAETAAAWYTSECENAFFTEMVSGVMIRDFLSYLPDDILVKVDRASMSVGLETRAPFLDVKVMELALKLPIEYKIDGGDLKLPLKHILSARLPRQMFDRPKQGFSVPISEWLRGPLRPWAESFLDEESLKHDNLLNVRLIREKWDEHLSGKKNWHQFLWHVLMFQGWYHNEKRWYF